MADPTMGKKPPMSRPTKGSRPRGTKPPMPNRPPASGDSRVDFRMGAKPGSGVEEPKGKPMAPSPAPATTTRARSFQAKADSKAMDSRPAKSKKAPKSIGKPPKSVVAKRAPASIPPEPKTNWRRRNAPNPRKVK